MRPQPQRKCHGSLLDGPQGIPCDRWGTIDELRWMMGRGSGGIGSCFFTSRLRCAGQKSQLDGTKWHRAEERQVTSFVHNMYEHCWL